jgi:hypothetical protein
VTAAPADSNIAANAHRRDVLQMYGIYRAYVIHEDTLIGQRTQRMLLVQGALFTAAGATFGKMFTDIQPYLGNPAVCHTHAAQAWAYTTALVIVDITGILAAFLSRGALKAAADAVEHLTKKWLATNRAWKKAGKATARELSLPGLRGGGSRLVHDRGQLHILIMPAYLMTLWGALLIALAYAGWHFRYCL